MPPGSVRVPLPLMRYFGKMWIDLMPKIVPDFAIYETILPIF